MLTQGWKMFWGSVVGGERTELGQESHVLMLRAQTGSAGAALSSAVPSPYKGVKKGIEPLGSSLLQTLRWMGDVQAAESQQGGGG